ncbi:MAG TPA: alpha/beta fold hydrolase [Thermoanaerobaculia bacterium]|jgi:surfactin synthase thioesterase subunit
MKWLAPSLLQTPARMRLFCLPYAGGGASAYRTWPAAMPAHVQVCPVQLPGRENRLPEVPYRSTATLVPALTEALRPFLDRPYAFFGHSMGGLLAYETARELRRRGAPMPHYLFISSHRAPQLPDRGTQMHRLSRPEFLKSLRELQGTPEEVLANEEMMTILEPVLRADFELCETYRHIPEEPLDVPMSIFGGTGDRDIPEEDLQAWQAETRAPSRVQMFPGHHLYLRDERLALIRAIVDDLSRAPAALPARTT